MQKPNKHVSPAHCLRLFRMMRSIARCWFYDRPVILLLPVDDTDTRPELGPTIQCFCWPGDWSTCHVKVGSGGQAVALTPRATSRCCRSACSNQPDKCSSPSVKLRFMRRRGKAHHQFFFYLSKVCSITFVRNFFIFPKFCSNFLF